MRLATQRLVSQIAELQGKPLGNGSQDRHGNAQQERNQLKAQQSRQTVAGNNNQHCPQQHRRPLGVGNRLAHVANQEGIDHGLDNHKTGAKHVERVAGLEQHKRHGQH